MSEDRVLVRAAAVADADAVYASPGVILLKQGQIIGSGSPQAIGHIADVRTVDLKDCVILPGLVNAHAHLDLTHIGPQPYPGSFVSFVNLVRSRRAASDSLVRESVLRGAELAKAGGTAFIGDIAGVISLTAVDALRASGLPGVSYLEVFGLGRTQASAIACLRQAVSECPHVDRDVALGLQPHAPYSCSLEVYKAAAELALPLSTHLAETLEELEFVRDATGPIAEMLRQIGVWDHSISPANRHPIDHLAAVLERRPFTAAHLNYVDDAHLERLARWPISVVYCPRASAYFGHPQDGSPRHRYLEMIQAGINVALGTDSMICLDTPDRISVLDEMRLLHRRDGADPGLLLGMATTNGARALSIDPTSVTLGVGSTSRLIAVPFRPGDGMEPLEAILNNDCAPKWVSVPHP